MTSMLEALGEVTSLPNWSVVEFIMNPSACEVFILSILYQCLGLAHIHIISIFIF